MKQLDQKSVRFEVCAIGDCSTCNVNDCPNYRKDNPIISDNEVIGAYVKPYSTHDTDYYHLDNVRCSTRPLIFQESQSVMALHGMPMPRETVLVIRGSSESSPYEGGVIIRIERPSLHGDYDISLRAQSNAIDDTGMYLVG